MCSSDLNTALCVSAERAFVAALEGGCQVPIGVHGRLVDSRLLLEAIVGLPDGSETLHDVGEIELGKIASNAIESQHIQKAKELGKNLAQSFINKGAREILSRAEKMAFV